MERNYHSDLTFGTPQIQEQGITYSSPRTPRSENLGALTGGSSSRFAPPMNTITLEYITQRQTQLRPMYCPPPPNHHTVSHPQPTRGYDRRYAATLEFIRRYDSTQRDPLSFETAPPGFPRPCHLPYPPNALSFSPRAVVLNQMGEPISGNLSAFTPVRPKLTQGHHSLSGIPLPPVTPSAVPVNHRNKPPPQVTPIQYTRRRKRTEECSEPHTRKARLTLEEIGESVLVSDDESEAEKEAAKQLEAIRKGKAKVGIKSNL